MLVEPCVKSLSCMLVYLKNKHSGKSNFFKYKTTFFFVVLFCYSGPFVKANNCVPLKLHVKVIGEGKISSFNRGFLKI